MQEVVALLSFLALGTCHFAVRRAAAGAKTSGPALLRPAGAEAPWPAAPQEDASDDPN